MVDCRCLLDNIDQTGLAWPGKECTCTVRDLRLPDYEIKLRAV